MATPNTHGEMIAEGVALIEKYLEPRVVTVDTAKFGDTSKIPVLLVPDGMKSIDIGPAISALRGHPDRRKGTAKVKDLDSFIEHTNRHMDASSVIFADPVREAPTMMTVFNYNAAGGDTPVEPTARFGDHRVVYAPALSDEFKVWKAVDGKPLDQEDFAEFLEDRILDIVALEDDEEQGAYNKVLNQFTELLGAKFATPSRMMELSRGVKIHANHKVTQITNTSTGEGRLSFSEEHMGGDGAPLTIPNIFLIVIPIFYAGTPYRIPVRLRYRLLGGSVKWIFQLYRIDRAFDAAFDAMCQTAISQTELPLFLGSPEPA